MPEPHARVIAVANQKGGVGKSTTAVSLGAAIAELGYRVLVVDLDPQGNASTGLGIRHEAREVTVYDVLAAEAPIEGAVVATPLENLFAIPSTIDLAGAEIELVSQFSREMRLRRALEPLTDGAYDFILLDCPPSLGLLTVNALAAAEELIVPIQCEYYALEGLGQLLRNVSLVQQNVNPGLRLTGIVMTMYDPRTKLSEQVVEEVRRYFGDRVYDTIIPRTVRLSEAPGFGQPITVYDPRSRGAQCYRDLAGEVVSKLPTDEGLPVIEDLPSVIVPPPQPEPVRAPRPLVRDELQPPAPSRAPRPLVGPGSSNGEEAGSPAGASTSDDSADMPTRPDLDRQVEEPTPAAPQADEPAPDSDGEPEVEAGSSSGAAAGPEAIPPQPEPALDAELESDVPDPDVPHEARRANETHREAVRSPTLEVGRVVVIDDEAEPEPTAPTLEAEPEDEGDAPRKRWSLFRRGGG